MKFNIKNKREQELQPAAATKANGDGIEDNRTVSLAQLKMNDGIPNNKIIQRKIIRNGFVFGHNDKRPTWRRSLKDWTVFVYNLHHQYGPQHPQALKASTNIGSRNLARTHKVPFQKMQLILENFCNRHETFGNLQLFCRLVIKQTSPAYATMTGLLQNLQAAVIANAIPNPVSMALVVSAANQLLNELHNSRDNILIGHSGTNSGIGERGDWNFAIAPGGQGVLTPISGEAYRALSTTLHQYDPGLYRPGGPGAQIASSHIMSSRPVTIIPHHPLYPGQPVYTTKNWRGPGYYQNGVLGAAGNIIHPPNSYMALPP